MAVTKVNLEGKSDAFKQEQRPKIIEALENNVVILKFVKKDGSIRKLVGTLSDRMVNLYLTRNKKELSDEMKERVQKRKENNPYVQPVIDLELVMDGSDGTPWRAFKYDKLISYEVLDLN